MSQFKFKEWLFKNFFPQYYKEYDTYKDTDGRGLLERFIDICSQYLDDNVVPDIDTFLDNLDVDKTNTIFLNYLWEYFGEMPFAWGILTKGITHWDEDNFTILKWVNTIKGFPKADTRKVLKYIISLYKIRGTSLFYEVLARFYGIKLDLISIPCEICNPNPNEEDAVSKQSEAPYSILVKAHYGNKAAYFSNGEYEFAGSFPLSGPDPDDCYSCVCYKVRLGIQAGLWEQLSQLDNWEERKKEIGELFTRVIEKYLPIYAKICNNQVELYSWSNTIMAISPMSLNAPVISSSKEASILPGNTSGIIVPPTRIELTTTSEEIKLEALVKVTASIIPYNADWKEEEVTWSYKGSGTTIGDVKIIPSGTTCNVLGMEVGQVTITCSVKNPKDGSLVTSSIDLQVVQGSSNLVKAHFEQKSAAYNNIGASFTKE